jgi:hypothetical protein
MGVDENAYVENGSKDGYIRLAVGGSGRIQDIKSRYNIYSMKCLLKTDPSYTE